MPACVRPVNRARTIAPMKLPHEFCRLPVRFDAERLSEEARALPAEAWKRHPLAYPGNSAVRLISGNGGENDDMGGRMAATGHLEKCPYIKQVLSSFGVAWSRSRLMMLGPGAQVPQHCDINYHWYTRVRVHIPVITFPEVRFYCGQAAVHMQAGEAWIFDNWRPHKVINPTPEHRIHLVADTVGNAGFWELARRGQWENFERRTGGEVSPLRFDPANSPELLTERFNVPAVMPPSELEVLLGDLLQDLAVPAQDRISIDALTRFRMLLNGLVQEWRHLWSLYGDSAEGWAAYMVLRDRVRQELRKVAAPVVMRSNQLSALQVADARVLRHSVNPPGTEAFRKPDQTPA